MHLCILLCALMFAGCGKKNYRDMKYLVVQNEKKGNWSIIDAKGNMVADEEYNADDEVSFVYDGMYWVKSGGAYSLYNIDNPKKPVVEKTWKRATMMSQGRSVVSNPGETIKLIDKNGDEVANLGENVRRVYGFPYDGPAAYQDGKSGKYGYIDRDGKMVVQAKYDSWNVFCDGKALVEVKSQKGDEETVIVKIINKNGKELGSFSKDKYTPLANVFTEGLLPVYRTGSKERRLEYLNEKGEVELTVSKSECNDNAYYNFVDGYAVFKNSERHCGLIDRKGETIIRPKYQNLIPLGNKRFAAQKNQKYGVIDEEDNTIIDFDYDYIMHLTLAGNYIVREDTRIDVLDTEGKSAFKNDFYDVSYFGCDSYAEYVNIKAAVADVVELINANDLGGIAASAGPAAAARLMKANAKAEDYKNSQSINGYINVNNEDINVRAEFYTPERPAVITLSHDERVGSGWWTYNKKVIDGYEFRKSPLLLANVTVTFNADGMSAERVADGVCKGIEAKGFTLENDLSDENPKAYKAKCKKCNDTNEENNYTRVSIAAKESYVSISYYYPAAMLKTLKVADVAVNSNISGNTAIAEVKNSGDDMTWLSTRLATAADVQGKSKADIRLMRNYIYARHGYKFKSQDLLKHFTQYSWYKPQYSDVSSMLSKTEQQNVAFLKKYE